MLGVLFSCSANQGSSRQASTNLLIVTPWGWGYMCVDTPEHPSRLLSCCLQGADAQLGMSCWQDILLGSSPIACVRVLHFCPDTITHSQCSCG